MVEELKVFRVCSAAVEVPRKVGVHGLTFRASFSLRISRLREQEVF